MTAQVSTQELQKKITGYLEDLIHETDQARKSESVQRYLEMMAKFHGYSFFNIMLIMLASPDATQVAGFQTWKKLGRWVRKGERGIPIFAPMIHREDPQDDDSPKVLNGFKVVYVFDLSQTEGNPLPSVPQWISPEQNPELKEKLLEFARSKGIAVTFKELPGEIQGASCGGSIEISPRAGTKTIVHEITHELLHRVDMTSILQIEREVEAESTAYIVCRHFGMTGLACPNYNALQGASGEIILKHLNRIIDVAGEIIEVIGKGE